MAWKPTKVLGATVGMIMLVTIVGVDAYLLYSLLNQSFGLNQFLTALLLLFSLPLVAIWTHWYLGFLTLRYYMDRNALIIACVNSRQVIPLAAVQRILPGSEMGVSQPFRGIGWPGYLKGQMRLKGLGLLMVHGTEPLERQLVVVTDQVCYGISPKQQAQFLDDFQARRSLGPIRAIQYSEEHATLVTLPIWHDRLLLGTLIAALLANIGLFGLVSAGWPSLPERIPLHFDAQGIVDRIGSKDGLLVVPSIGSLTLLVNTLLSFLLHQRERLGSFLLAFSNLGIQCVLWIATVGILAH